MNLLGIRGVRLVKGGNRKGWRFMARITDKQGKKRLLGYSKCPIVAANLYDAAALEVHGKDAKLNNLNELTPEHEAHINRMVDEFKNPPPVFKNGEANWEPKKVPFVPTPPPPVHVFKDGKATWS